MIGHAEKLEPRIRGDRVGRRVRKTAPHRIPNTRRWRILADTEQVARQRGDDVKREHASVGQRAGIVNHRAVDTFEERVAEPALSDARLGTDENDVRSTGFPLAQRAFEPRELARAADETREAARP